MEYPELNARIEPISLALSYLQLLGKLQALSGQDHFVIKTKKRGRQASPLLLVPKPD
jgi:hypothetical protein